MRRSARILSICSVLLIIACSDDGAVDPDADGPVLNSVTPSVAAQGDTVRLQGLRFGSIQGGGSVSFDNVRAQDYIFWSDTLIILRVPVDITPRLIIIRTERGETSRSDQFRLESKSLELSLPGHNGIVRSARFSPDATMLVTVGDDNDAIVWNLASGSPRIFFEVEASLGSLQADFSPDGTLLATLKGTAVEIWNIANGRLIQRLEEDTEKMNSVVFGPDGASLLTAKGLDAILWDLASGEVLRRFELSAGVLGAVFSPDGQRILSYGTTLFARVWNIASGEVLLEMEHPENVHVAAYSADGNRIMTLFERFDFSGGTGLQSGIVRIWDAEGGSLIQELGEYLETTIAALHPDGDRFVVSGWFPSQRNAALLIDVVSAARRQAFSGHSNFIYSCAFSPDGSRMVSGSADGSAKIWQVE